MAGKRAGETAVIFTSRRTAADDAGYAEAADAMAALAAAQPGYRGVASVRDADRVGITVSYWADAASAEAWRDHPDHVRIRNAGRERWYESYEVVVAEVTRDYRWRKG
jgi:heme-degrading monooxygenase HmoA